MEFFDNLPTGRIIRPDPIDWESAKAAMLENPGQWGLIATNVSSSTAQQVRAGRNKRFRGDDLERFEFRTRRPKDLSDGYGPRRTDLYGRYKDA